MTKYGMRTRSIARGGVSLTALLFVSAMGCSAASAQTLASPSPASAPASSAVTGVVAAPVQLAQAEPSVTGGSGGAQEIVVQGLRRSI